MRFLGIFLIPLLSFGQPCNTLPQHKRHALVVGNWKYDHLPAVQTAHEDLGLMKAALESTGFEVTSIENATMPALFQPMQSDFLAKVQAGDVVFFFYSGHVVQAIGQDFILPVNFDDSMDLASGGGFSLNRFQEELNKKKPGLTILMIEGPHPIGAEIPGVRRPGLVFPDLPDNGDLLFATAAKQGEIANSEAGTKVGRFTNIVARLLREAGLSPSRLFDRAKREVLLQSGGSQVLGIDDRITSDALNFCFVEPPPAPISPPAPDGPVTVEVPIPIPSNRIDREEYVKIRAGKFLMGCVPNDSRCKDDEKPQHEVTLTKDFYIGRNEVKVESFLSYRTQNKIKTKLPSAPLQDYEKWKIGNLPMVRVSWDDAQGYCRWAGGRLPTEAEWEYAARAGNANEVYPLNTENSREKANFSGTKGNDIYMGVAPVRKFDENKLHLYDLLGNVWEWVSDWYSKRYYVDSPPNDPQGPPAGNEHIVRGGSFESDWQEHLRLSLRWPQAKENYRTGFRCVLDDTPQTRQLLMVH